MRQYVSAALYAAKSDAYKTDVYRWLNYAGGPESENYLAQSIYGVSFRAKMRFSEDELDDLVRTRERFIANVHNPKPYKNLILTTIDRALISSIYQCWSSRFGSRIKS